MAAPKRQRRRRRRRRRDVAPLGRPAPPTGAAQRGGAAPQEEEQGEEEVAVSPEEQAEEEAAVPLSAGDESQIVPEFAFHTWDLIAFLGFEFEPDFQPSAEDLKFQSKIRQMVMNFVRRLPLEEEESGAQVREKEEEGSSDRRAREQTRRQSHGDDSPPPPPPLGYTLFSREGSRRQILGGAYKADECNFWHKHLGRSYAWVS